MGQRVSLRERLLGRQYGGDVSGSAAGGFLQVRVYPAVVPRA